MAGIVLAAGSSTRMGCNKLLLEVGGEALVRRAARTALRAGLDPVVVVVGHEREAVGAQVADLGCDVQFNEDHEGGIHTTVATGVARVDESAAAVVVLADMPFVTAGMLRTLAAHHRETGAPLVISRYGAGLHAPPVLYDRRLFGELGRMDARCGRGVRRRHRRDAAEVVWPLGAARDLDRAADYEQVRRELAPRSAARAPHPGTLAPPGARSSPGPLAATTKAPAGSPSPWPVTALPAPRTGVRE